MPLSSKQRNKKGITLIEILVVVTIAQILLGIVYLAGQKVLASAKDAKYYSHVEQSLTLVRVAYLDNKIPNLDGDYSCMGDYTWNDGRCWGEYDRQNSILDNELRSMLGTPDLYDGVTNQYYFEHGTMLQSSAGDITFFWRTETTGLNSEEACTIGGIVGTRDDVDLCYYELN